MFLKKKKEVLGIDIGSSSIKLVQLKRQKSGYQLQNIGIVSLPAEAIVDNTLMDNSSVVEGIKSLTESLKITAKEAVCSISGNSVIIRKITLPIMPLEELEEQIHWEAEQYIPFDINDVNIDFQIIAPDDFDSSKMNVLLVASKKDIINDYLAVFTEAGLRLTVMDVDSFAVQNAFELSNDADPTDVFALVNIGASIMNMNIIKNGISLFTRDVQVGGNLYNEEIQKVFGVNNEGAEKIKISNLDDTKLHESLLKINNTLAIEMRRSLDFYNSTAGDGKICKVFLSGGAAKTAGLLEVVNDRLGIPAEIIKPFSRIKWDLKEFDQDYLEELGPLVTVAIGLATRRLGDK